MDTSVATVRNSREECTSPIDDRGESGQCSVLFTEGKYP